MEKWRGCKNTIATLKIKDQNTDDPIQILNEIRNFYEKLYKSESSSPLDRNMQEHFLENEPVPKITMAEREENDKDIILQ